MTDLRLVLSRALGSPFASRVAAVEAWMGAWGLGLPALETSLRVGSTHGARMMIERVPAGAVSSCFDALGVALPPRGRALV